MNKSTELLEFEQRRLYAEREVLHKTLISIRKNYDLTVYDMEVRLLDEICEMDKLISGLVDQIEQSKTAGISHIADWYAASKEIIDEQFSDRVRSQRGVRGSLPDVINYER